jgi:hypothetical protein
MRDGCHDAYVQVLSWLLPILRRVEYIRIMIVAGAR